MIKLKFKRLRSDAVAPKYAHDDDVGMDFFSAENVQIRPAERVRIPTGISIELPHGYAGLIWDKSGISFHDGLKTIGGVIDSGYRGEILVGMVNLSKSKQKIEKGSKIAQMLIQKVERVGLVEVKTLSKTERGEGGFGSTGK